MPALPGYERLEGLDATVWAPFREGREVFRVALDRFGVAFAVRWGLDDLVAGPLWSREVVEEFFAEGRPFSAARPTTVPRTPPTKAPTGPPTTAPSTAPVAPPATFLRIWNC